MKKSFVLITCQIVVLLTLLAITGCQYEYSSPLPGTVDVYLKSVSNKIQFSPLNNFVLRVREVEAVRTDEARVKIYEDVDAIQRTVSVYNTLDVRARDSSLIIGRQYLPPGNYKGINILITPGSQVLLDGYRDPSVVLPERFDPTLEFRKPFEVLELRKTSIILTIDLDSTLVQGVDQYYFKPYYYISSITVQ